jgi:hypothetical protein
VGHELLQQFESFRIQLEREGREPGDVTTGPSEICDDTATDRITDGAQHDWNSRGRLLGRERGRRSHCDDEVRFPAHNIRRECREAIGTRSRPCVLEGDVVALEISELAETVTQPFDRGRGSVREDRDPLYLSRLLRLAAGRRGEQKRHYGGKSDNHEPHAVPSGQRTAGEGTALVVTMGTPVAHLPNARGEQPRSASALLRS